MSATELAIGRVVRSKAGRDRGGFLAVVGTDGKDVFLADGRKRPLERPKRKRRIHLCVTNTVLEQGSMRSNRELRRALRTLCEGAARNNP